MFGIKKIVTMILSVAVCLSFAIAAGAVGDDEFFASVTPDGTNGVRINFKNDSEYYLANVELKINSGSAEIVSYSIIGDDDGKIRQVAPGESISASVKLKQSAVTGTTGAKPSDGTQAQLTTSGTKNPVSGGKPSDNGEVTVATGVAVITDDNGDNGNDDKNAVTSADVSGSVSEGSESESVTTVHKGESVTTDGETDENAAVGSDDAANVTAGTDGDKEGTSGVIWWISGGAAVALCAAGVVTYVLIRKKKMSAKDIATVLVIGFVLTAILAGDAARMFSVQVYADGISSPVAGKINNRIYLNNTVFGNVYVDAEITYTVVPKAVVNPLKSNRRPPAGDECITPNVDIRRIKENSGPLTDHGIYVGKNNFMFFGQALNDYRGESIMSDARMRKLVDMMNQRDKWAKDNGIKLYLVIAPNKSTVYPDYVPSKVNAAQTTNADIAIAKLVQESTVEVIDLRQTLKDARREYGDGLFYKYDTHWNNNGGFVAYTEVMNHVNGDVSGAYTLTKNDFDISEHETYMKDMLYYLGHYTAFQDYGPVYTLKSGMTAKLLRKDSTERHGQFRFCSAWNDGYFDAVKYAVYENPYNEGAPSVYMIRDSFSIAMIHYVKDSFHKSTFDWTYEFGRDKILNSGADVVIMEVVEKQLEEFVNTRTFS